MAKEIDNTTNNADNKKIEQTVSESQPQTELDNVTKDVVSKQGETNALDFESKYNDLVKEVKIKEVLDNSSFKSSQYKDIMALLTNKDVEGDLKSRITTLTKIVDDVLAQTKLPKASDNANSIFEKIKMSGAVLKSEPKTKQEMENDKWEKIAEKRGYKAEN